MSVAILVSMLLLTASPSSLSAQTDNARITAHLAAGEFSWPVDPPKQFPTLPSATAN